MKRLALVALMLVAAPLFAQVPDPEKPLEVGGISQLLSDKIKEAKGALIVTAHLAPQSALYLPVWTFHDGAGVDLVELGGGGRWQKSAHGGQPILVAAVNAPGISGKIWGFQWAKDHLRRSPFPPIFLGPSITAPMELHELRAMRWDHWLDYLGIVCSVRLGGK